MPGTPERTLAISATFTAEPINESLEFWFERLKLSFKIRHAAFNQVFQTLLDPAGVFATNHDGVNVVLVRWQDFGEGEQLQANAASFVETLSRAASQMKVPLVVVSCPCSPSFLEVEQRAGLAAQLDTRLAKLVESVSNLHLLPAAAIENLYPVSEIDDPIGERLGDIPFTGEFFAALGTCLVRKALSFSRPPRKVAVVDLDNTVWGGVVGEDGWEQVRIEPAHRELQQFLLEQRRDGLLLAICSKNNENDAWEVFERRPEMLLKKEHIAAWRIDWNPKSANIRAIAKDLSLGADSFVFLDDDSKECAEMRANAPEVLTIQVPKDGTVLGHFLRHMWAFDRAKATAEDRKRGESYQQEIARGAEAKKAATLEDFVAALDLKVTIEPLRAEMLPRVAQLTQRTNQFNTTTIRRTEGEIRSALEAGTLHCITIAVTDRFGDYGNVGAVLYSLDSAALVVDSFLLSCRALGRGVEHQIVRYLGAEALRQNLGEVALRFIASPKNAPALQFLDSLESTGESGGLYVRLFRVKADYASQLAYRPVAYAGLKEVESQAESMPESTPRALPSAAIDYQEIASELSTVPAIRREIRKARTSVGTPVGSDPTAPRNAIEAKLASIWADVLQVPSVGIHDDFFELGGDSLRAVELLVRILDSYDDSSDAPEMTLSTLLESPTVASFAAILGQRREVRCLVPLRETGSRPPFFCVPGGGGNVLSFRTLAMNLPEDQPFWALQAPGLDGSATVDNASEVAALYLDEVRTVQPRGPYFLGGGSYGGVIAFEMAQQLIAQGEQVALLALLDTYNLAYGKMIPRTKAIYCHARFFAQRAAAATWRLARTPAKQWPKHVRQLGRTSAKLAGGMLRMVVSPPKNQSQPKPAGPVRDLKAEPNRAIEVLERVRDANMRAVERYTPKPFPGKITLFRASIRMSEPYQDKYLGWKPVAAGGIEMEIVPGHHSGFDRRELGEALDRHLRRAQNQYLAGNAQVDRSAEMHVAPA
jgi:FkbH-like protein